MFEYLQVVLTQLYEWLHLFNLLPSQLLTSHSLLGVSTGEIVGRVYPQLTAILDQVTSTGIQQAMTLCEKVLEEIKQRAEVRHQSISLFTYAVEIYDIVQ